MTFLTSIMYVLLGLVVGGFLGIIRVFFYIFVR